ncbi:hypothetical protein GYMLUDRAFT_491804 [Collybiopsis luxurians FD-317 M1]|uniref:Uncharacterized protein n=1 Tax=Collybiopsis luxurians FD-317 M1 TaxID=944289 RepID=A0A0D0CTP2_9AGAR|nr:hypothetical protein GYMLUDRAFT_491804 [Collybiopsis luxurians FD-317 M1]
MRLLLFRIENQLDNSYPPGVGNALGQRHPNHHHQRCWIGSACIRAGVSHGIDQRYLNQIRRKDGRVHALGQQDGIWNWMRVFPFGQKRRP